MPLPLSARVAAQVRRWFAHTSLPRMRRAPRRARMGSPPEQRFRLEELETRDTPAGVEFLVNSTTSGSQSDPAVGVASDGRFVVVWGGSSTGDADGGVFVRT